MPKFVNISNVGEPINLLNVECILQIQGFERTHLTCGKLDPDTRQGVAQLTLGISVSEFVRRVNQEAWVV